MATQPFVTPEPATVRWLWSASVRRSLEGAEYIDEEPETIEKLVARALIPLDRLCETLAWAWTEQEAADDRWVDRQTLLTRLKRLHLPRRPSCDAGSNTERKQHEAQGPAGVRGSAG